MFAQKILRLAAMVAIVIGAVCPRGSEAQVLYGSIVGSLQDQTGAAVPDASLTITNNETGQTRDTKSDAQGNFTITNVLPGRYEVRINATGFRTVTQKSLDVSAGATARLDFRLEVGQLTESIEVAGE